MIFCMEEWNTGPSGWRELAGDLGGSFAARARGVVSPELVLLTEAGEPFGARVPAAGSVAQVTPRAANPSR